MAVSVYRINKGINKPIEFKGLKAQYIGLLGAGLVTLLILFAVLYIIGAGMLICLGVAFVLGPMLIVSVYRMSKKYGEHGLMKIRASRSIPDCVACRSRKVFSKIRQK